MYLNDKEKAVLESKIGLDLTYNVFKSLSYLKSLYHLRLDLTYNVFK